VSAARREPQDEVEQLLLNARLRDELEPFLDESVEVVNTRVMPTDQENEYLASMLEWERAPVLPICCWFQPKLVLPAPETLSGQQLHDLLWDTIEKLYDQRIVLDFTDHLTDRQLYCLICRDILPSSEKKIDRSRTFLHWQCIDAADDPEVWLRYYATQDERQTWQEETGGVLPPSQPPPYPRRMPRRLL
jgi:hypothetical protein